MHAHDVANKSLEKNIFHRVENVIKQLVHTSAVRSSRYEARGKFGGHERCIIVARGGEQLLLLLQPKQNVTKTTIVDPRGTQRKS